MRPKALQSPGSAGAQDSGVSAVIPKIRGLLSHHVLLHRLVQDPICFKNAGIPLTQAAFGCDPIRRELMSIKEEKIHGFSALMHLAERICGVKHKRFLLAPRVCPGRIYRFSPSAIYAPRTFVRSKSVLSPGQAAAARPKWMSAERRAPPSSDPDAL